MSPEKLMITEADLASLGPWIERWRTGGELVFAGGLHLDQGVIDQLIVDGAIERVRIYRCVFDGPITFRACRFLDDDFYFGFNVFSEDVSFSGCHFAGATKVNLKSNSFNASVDFSGVDFGEGSMSIAVQHLGDHCSFENARFGAQATIVGDYDGTVSFRNCQFATTRMYFNATFNGLVDFTRAHLPATSEWFIQGPNAARAFHGKVIADEMRLDGTVSVASPELPEITAWQTPAQPGDRVPFTAPISVAFEVGSLAGNSYKLDTGVGVCGLLNRLKGDHTVLVSRGDADFAIRINAQFGQMVITETAGGESVQLALSDANGLDEILASMAVA